MPEWVSRIIITAFWGLILVVGGGSFNYLRDTDSRLWARIASAEDKADKRIDKSKEEVKEDIRDLKEDVKSIRNEQRNMMIEQTKILERIERKVSE